MDLSSITRLASRELAADGSVPPPLSQAVGYVIVVVIGLAVAFSKYLPAGIKSEFLTIFVAMVFITQLLKKTVGEDNKKTEM